MAHPIIDEIITDKLPRDFLCQKHVNFLIQCTKHNDCTLDFLKISGIYWTITALDLLGALDKVDRNEIIEFVLSCQQSDGGFSPSVNYDSHLLSTLSAIQILSLFDNLEKIDHTAVCNYISKLQNSDGSFNGDKWGEVDTRFSFCAIASLTLLGKLSEGIIDTESAASFLERCQNLDGGFGLRPGAESHAGQAYCVVGSLSLLNQLRRLNVNQATWWLAERQLPSGGLNGRPEKKPDVCYSWWILASLSILGCINWIKDDDLCRFIMASQDSDTGGISDRPGNMADPFHTLFGIAGLNLITQRNVYNFNLNCTSNGLNDKNDSHHPNQTEPLDDCLYAFKHYIKNIDPVFCMPQYVLDRMSIKTQLLT